MFGLTKREQRWAAEQKAAETIVPLLTAAIEARTAMDTNDRIAALKRDLAQAVQMYTDAAGERDKALADLAAIIVQRDEALIAESKAIADLATAKAQLPAEMQECTIVFKECENGHGWLTATNWVQHGCPTCELAAAQAERDDANKECGFRIGERDEARADAVALREQYGRLCDIFRVNMLRAFPDKSHAEIDAAIDAARKEGA